MTETGSRTSTSRLIRPPRLIAQILVAGTVLTIATAIARNPLPTWEEETFKWLHDVPAWVDHVLWLPMQLGSAWAPIVTAAVAYGLTKSWRPTTGALVAGWGGWWLAKVIKEWVDRGRPYEEIGPENVRDSALQDGLGFVSGHATVAFACAAILSPYLPRRWCVAVYLLAALVALSRVVIGAHLPLDAIGGACLGLILAWVWHLLVGIDTTRRLV